MSNIRRRSVAFATFALHNAQWMDLAAEVLFRNDRLRDEENYNIQQAVAEALKLVWKMGAEGREPPTPAGAARSYLPPPTDPEIERVAGELRLLAWHPKAGTPAPEGYLKWKLSQNKPKTAPPVVRRRSTPEPEPIKPVVRRRR